MVSWLFSAASAFAGAAQTDALSTEAHEILGDFGTIAATRFEYADSEEDERALADVIEFIRAGTLLLHAELTGLVPPDATLH